MILRDNDEIALGDSDYRVYVDDGTTRYASKERGIVVEVRGRLVVVRSSPEFPPRQSEATDQTKKWQKSLPPNSNFCR